MTWFCYSLAVMVTNEWLLLLLVAVVVVVMVVVVLLLLLLLLLLVVVVVVEVAWSYTAATGRYSIPVCL